MQEMSENICLQDMHSSNQLKGYKTLSLSLSLSTKGKGSTDIVLILIIYTLGTSSESNIKKV